jgi:hypothetical protein
MVDIAGPSRRAAARHSVGVAKAFVTLSFTKKTFSVERKHPYFST